MTLPDQLLLSDLLRRRVRCDQGEDHGPGCLAWMHPPVHRLLGWISRPSSFGSRRLAWRLDQLIGFGEVDVLVRGEGAVTDQETIERLPTLLEAALIGRHGQQLGHLADAAVELRSGRILHYLVSRSDPRLPGSSRWRLTPDRILDQEPGQVRTGLEQLDDLPLARASVRQELLRRSRRWREQFDQETGRWREQFQQVGDRVEDRLEGWLEEPPWEPEASRSERSSASTSSSEDPLFDDWEHDGSVDTFRSRRPVVDRDDDRPSHRPLDNESFADGFFADSTADDDRFQEQPGDPRLRPRVRGRDVARDPEPEIDRRPSRRVRSHPDGAWDDRGGSEDPWI